MTPSNILDITQTQNAGSLVKILNSNGSSGAFCGFRTYNGTVTFDLVQYGTGASAYGAIPASGSALYTTGTALVLMADNASGVIKFAAGGSAEKVRVGSDGSFLVGTTANEGAGNISAANNIIAGRAGGVNNYMLVEHATGSISGSDYIWFRYNGTQIGGAAQSGTTAVVYNTTSDARLKTVLENQRDWRKAISNLWIGDFDKYTTFEKTGNGERHFGVLAQQANDALDGLGITKPTKDDDVWMASAEPFAFLALWGVKDLYKIIDDLTARLTALENK
jgi:hypothetical protein